MKSGGSNEFSCVPTTDTPITPPTGVSRRRFLREAVLGAAFVAGESLGRRAMAATRQRSTRRPTVAVLGGGVAGLTVAHELVERGFQVDVFERRALGGKARSIPVPGTAAGGRLPLPGEHAFRAFFGYYQNLPDTLRRIPVADGARSVHDNLVETGELLLSRAGGRSDLWIPLGLDGPPDPLTPDRAARQLVGLMQVVARLPPLEAAFLARQLAIFFSSSDERRLGEWERTSWWDFVRADRMSDEYRAVGNFVPKAVALRPQLASTRSVGKYWELALYTEVGLGNDGARDQVLNGPTNETWIDPWADYLSSRGVRFWIGQTVTALNLSGGRVVSARAMDENGSEREIEADWFVCALPVERARELWTPEILNADPRLESMHRIRTTWGNGIQFFLRREVPVIRGHVIYVDSPWSVMSVSHAQFWNRDFANAYGDGGATECFSTTIAEWDEPGIVYGKPARECTAAELAREVWMQIKAHLEDTGQTYLPDDVLQSWFVDPALQLPGSGGGEATNDDALFLTSVGSWDDRPEAATSIPNLFLAGDYVQTSIDAATMEGANEAGRNAVNVVLAESGSDSPPVEIRPLYQPPEFEPDKAVDRELYRRGLPHLLDTPWPFT